MLSVTIFFLLPARKMVIGTLSPILDLLDDRPTMFFLFQSCTVDILFLPSTELIIPGSTISVNRGFLPNLFSTAV